MIRLLVRLLAASALFVAVAAASQEQPPTPPEPPITLDKGATPLVYRSNVGNLVNKDNKKEGSLVYKEWWYWSKGVEGTYVTGIAEVTITPSRDVAEPMFGGLHSFRFTLDKYGNDCIPYKHDPDTNKSPITVSGGVTAQIGGGSNIQPAVGVGGTIREDRVTIEELHHDERRAEWSADVGGGRKKSGVNGLVFIASWICPKNWEKLISVLPRDVHGYGVAHFDWYYSADKKYFFSPTRAQPLSESGPPRTNTDCFEYFYKDGHWVCAAKQEEAASQGTAPQPSGTSGMQAAPKQAGQAPLKQEQQPSGTGGTQEAPKRVGQAPLKQENSEQRVARADTIEALPIAGNSSVASLPAAGVAILAAHNAERVSVGVPPLRWNPVLAMHASEFAQELAQSGQLTHAPREGRGIERENLSEGNLWWTTAQMINSWLSEKQFFHPGIFPDVCNGDWSKCAHYSQMIWPTTTDIGCGEASGSRHRWLVCRYSPGGNKDGKLVGLAEAATTDQWIDVKTGKPVRSGPIVGKIEVSSSGPQPAKPDGLPTYTGAIRPTGEYAYVALLPDSTDANRAFDPASGRNFAKEPLEHKKADIQKRR